MSMTAFERANPPPRRKSCAACTKAKRRCDLGQPSCLRCAGRGIECHYPHGSSRPHNNHRLASLLSAPGTPSPNLSPSVVSLETPASTPVSALNKTAETFSFDALLDEFLAREPVALNGPIGGVGGGGLSYGMDVVQELSPQSDSTINLPGLDNHDLLMAGETGQLVPVDYGIPTRLMESPCVEPLPHLIQDRLQYTLGILRQTPKTLVDSLEAPWCHPALFDDHMPKATQDAIACCAMYNSMNNFNKPFIMKIIMGRSKELAESPIPSAPLEALARCQALLIYHLMGLLDGDIQFRASAEQTCHSVRQAAKSLVDVISAYETQYNLTSTRELPLFPITETETFWRAWLFAESARRTALLSFHFLLIYEIMTEKRPVSCEDAMLCERWTLSTFLWKAQTPVDFAVAWRSKKHLIVRCVSFEETIREAEPDDLDEFGRMLLTSFMGQEQTRGWFASKGGKL
ncbi:hypothetical protein jhhlp_005790 [Lomentospora prolificans]|uniref:Zn(2)-C6 fungal-type domain-containing protein n=1 Tax=Lomentospora prolificans TaxID=41688 RepID=A0A2N3N428_9PEZI|nr:hypothetical protein jhhlp_005790 [Lomentospora prolificans]